MMTELGIVLGCKYTKIGNVNVSVRNDPRHLQGWGRNNLNFYMGHPDVDLDLKLYIDQSATISKEDIFSNIECRIGEFLHEVEGVFLQRSIHPFRDDKAMTVSYTIKLKDYNTFITKLSYLARTKSDREFTKVLEEKLTE